MPRGLRDPELEAQVEMQADQYIPFPMDEVSYDFEVLGQSEKDADSVDVLLVASRTENVAQRRSAVVAAGLVHAHRRCRGVRARERLSADDASDARRRHRSQHRGGRFRRQQHDLQRAAQSQGRLHARFRLRRPAADRRNHAHLRTVDGGSRPGQEGRRPAGQLPGRSARPVHRRHDPAGQPLDAVLSCLRHRARAARQDPDLRRLRQHSRAWPTWCKAASASAPNAAIRSDR